MSSIESTVITPEDEANLDLAMEQAQKSLKEGGVPIGSVVSSFPRRPVELRLVCCSDNFGQLAALVMSAVAVPSPDQEGALCRPQPARAGRSARPLVRSLSPSELTPLLSSPLVLKA